jgi:hypothetical protein
MKQTLIPTIRKSTVPQKESLSEPKILPTTKTRSLTPKEPVDIIRHST